MRILSKKQKKYIDELMSKSVIDSSDDVRVDEYVYCRSMNDHETFESNLERYIHDKVMEARHGTNSNYES